MLPDSVLSSIPVPGTLLHPDNLVTSPLRDYELGGVALNDPSQGLKVQVWQCFVDGDNIMIQAGDASPSILFTAAGTTEVALAFDQNMRPAVAFKQAGTVKLRWYDTLAAAQVITEYPGVDNARLAMDDKRPLQTAANDIIMAYTRDEGLYFRAQRDRFLVEYPLDPAIGAGRLIRIGMNNVNRMQFEFVAGADTGAAVFPRTDAKWLIPSDSGFGEGEQVGLWAEGFGFLGFQRIEREGDDLLVEFDPAGVPESQRPTELVIGYPYSAKFQPLPLAEGDQRGPYLGRKRRLVRAIFSVHETGQLMADNIPVLPAVGDPLLRDLRSTTGLFEVRMLGWTADDQLEVEAVSPYHATIRAMSREYSS